MNARFAELFADGVPPSTPLAVKSGGPPSSDPNRGDGARLPSAECLRGDVAEGFSLVVYEGGSVAGLAACAASRGVAALYVLHGAGWVSYHLGAPEIVNRGFRELFAGGLPAITPLAAKWRAGE